MFVLTMGLVDFVVYLGPGNLIISALVGLRSLSAEFYTRRSFSSMISSRLFF
jgi:hypothetical protein